MIFQGHQYETVSGFVCESFGYIPEEGGKIIVVFEKADNKVDTEDTETTADDHDEERFQSFELEVLLDTSLVTSTEHLYSLEFPVYMFSKEVKLFMKFYLERFLKFIIMLNPQLKYFLILNYLNRTTLAVRFVSILHVQRIKIVHEFLFRKIPKATI